MRTIKEVNLECNYKDRVINFKVVYSQRRTMSIEVNLKGEVRILSPQKVSTKSILDVVEKKGSWICKKQDELMEKNLIKPTYNYESGEKFLFQGKEYTLFIKHDIEAKNPKVLIDSDFIKVIYKDVNSETIKYILELWYRERTLEIVTKRVEKYNMFFKDKPKELKVKQQKRRWASCTYDNRILFNWRISMAPIEVVDYIVVHEMCHMDFKDHSINFWNRVRCVMPDYEIHKTWLKENGLKLDI